MVDQSDSKPSPIVRSSWVWALGVLLVAGLCAWIYELWQGLAVTGMRDVVSWEMYIFTFAYFVGLSAGGLIVTFSAEVFHIAALRPLSRLGVLTAMVLSAAAGLMIIPDLSKPQRILNLMFHPNWLSPLEWDVTIITVYFVFSAVELCLMWRVPERKRLFLTLGYIGLPLAVLLHSITAIIFGLQFARVWWNTALMAPIFVASAIVSGTALIVLIVWIVQRFNGVLIPAATWRWLAGLMIISFAIDLFFFGLRLRHHSVGQHPGRPGGAQFTFWLEWVVGGIIPYALT